jgi:hypothetical protein
MSLLTAFNTQLIRFFEQLHESFPEEREIKMSLEAIQGLKKINPKMIFDLFFEYVYVPIGDALVREDEELVIGYAKKMIDSQFNEMSVALMIFNKHWPNLSENNRKVIWDYLKVLVVLCEKVKGVKN